MSSERLGTAEWADPEQFDTAYPYEPGKFWLGRSPRSRQALGYTDDRHVCLVSGSRAGKGTTTIVPNLCTWPGSVIVVDPKGENATLTAARRGPGSEHCDGLGQAVHVLDPFEAAEVDASVRASFNPLDALDPDDPGCLDDVGRLADAIVVANPDASDPFWEQSARTLVKGLILHVLTAADFEGRRNLLTVRQLITRGDRDAVEGLRAMGEEALPSAQPFLWFRVTKNPAFDGNLAGIGETILGMAERSPKQFESVLQVANRNTEFLDSAAMKACLSSSSFSLSDLKTAAAGVSLYLSLPQRYMGEHFRWLRLILTLVVTEMEAVPGQPASGHPVLMCLDEFAGLKRMEIIENAVAQIAGFGVKLFFVLQSLEQLKATYPDGWETFLANAGLKMFYGIDDHFTRDYVSKFIGETEVLRTVRSEGESASESTSSTSGESSGSSVTRTEGDAENWSTSHTEGSSIGRSSSSNWKTMPLFFRDTAGFFRALVGNMQANDSRSHGTSRGSSETSGGSSSSSQGTSETTGRSTSQGTGSATSRSSSQNETLHKRALITPDEVGRHFGRVDAPDSPVRPGFGLVLITGKAPAVVQRANYFEDPLFARQYEPHPDHPQGAAFVSRTVSLSADDFDGLRRAASDQIYFDWHVDDGDTVRRGDPLCSIHGFGPSVESIEKAMEVRYSFESVYTALKRDERDESGDDDPPALYPHFPDNGTSVRLLAPCDGLVQLTPAARALYPPHAHHQPRERDGHTLPELHHRRQPPGENVYKQHLQPEHASVVMRSRALEPSTCLETDPDLSALAGANERWSSFCFEHFERRLAYIKSASIVLGVLCVVALLVPLGFHLFGGAVKEALGVIGAVGAWLVALGIVGFALFKISLMYSDADQFKWLRAHHAKRIGA